MNADQAYSLMFLISTLFENSNKINLLDDTNKRQKEVSPVAQRCIQDILEALLENYKFKDSSLQLYREAKKRSELKKQARQEIKFTFREPYDLAPQIDETNEKGIKEDVYYGESWKERILIKETSGLVMLFAAIVNNCPYLTPYLLFKEEGSYRESVENLTGRKSLRKMSIMNILLGVLLCKNEDAVILLVSNLIDSMTKNAKMMELIMIRILEIFKNLMDDDEILGSLESMLLRRNIGLIIINLSNVINNPENAIFEKKQEIQGLILSVTEKLFDNPAIIAHSAENSLGESSLLFIIKKIFEENQRQEKESGESKEIKKSYPEILKAVELESETTDLQNDNQFEQYMFKTDLEENNDQCQRQEEETNKFCQLASLGEEYKNFIDPIKLLIDPKENFAQGFILKQPSSYVENLVEFYKSLPSQNEIGYDFLKERIIYNDDLLQGYEASKDQTFNNSENFDYLPLLLRAKYGTIKDIEM